MDAGPLITTLEKLMGPLRDLRNQQGPSGSNSIKPASVVVREYEGAVYAFRDQRLPSAVKSVSALLVESLDAFESGRVLEAGRAVMQAIEQFEQGGKDAAVTISPEQVAKLGQFRSTLFNMVIPKPELNQQRINL